MKTINDKTNETKSNFLENSYNIDNHLVRLTKKMYITNIRNETGVITIDSDGTKRIIREYYEQLDIS